MRLISTTFFIGEDFISEFFFLVITYRIKIGHKYGYFSKTPSIGPMYDRDFFECFDFQNMNKKKFEPFPFRTGLI